MYTVAFLFIIVFVQLTLLNIPIYICIRIMNMVKMALHSSPFEIQEDVEGGIIGSSSLCLRMWTCKGLIMRDSGENSLCKVRR